MEPSTAVRERSLLDQAFSRAAGAQRIGGNAVRLLRDAAESYPAWLDAIASAERYVHFESYIIRDDVSGRRFADALMAKARAGVRVRVLYDWMGAVGKTPRRFWSALRAAGVEVRCFNPLRLSSPLGWVHRDHRKSLVVDGMVGHVTGLCVGDAWVGDPARGIAPWRDTGVEVRGPAVAEIERAFERTWAVAGPPLAPDDRDPEPPGPAGDVTVRIVASEPARGALLRVDELVAAAARETLWLTDAYFAGTSLLRAGAPVGGARRRRRAAARARRHRHPAPPAPVAGRLPAAARGGRAGVRVERSHDACQDRGRRRTVGPEQHT